MAKPDRPPRVYLDNAATSWPKPPAVYDAVERYMRDNGTAAGRGMYADAQHVARKFVYVDVAFSLRLLTAFCACRRWIGCRLGAHDAIAVISVFSDGWRNVVRRIIGLVSAM